MGVGLLRGCPRVGVSTWWVHPWEFEFPMVGGCILVVAPSPPSPPPRPRPEEAPGPVDRPGDPGADPVEPPKLRVEALEPNTGAGEDAGAREPEGPGPASGPGPLGDHGGGTGTWPLIRSNVPIQGHHRPLVVCVLKLLPVIRQLESLQQASTGTRVHL